MAMKITRVNNVSNLKVQSDESVWFLGLITADDDHGHTVVPSTFMLLLRRLYQQSAMQMNGCRH